MRVNRTLADSLTEQAFADAYGMSTAYTSGGMRYRKGVARDPSASKARAKIRTGIATSTTDAIADDPGAFSISTVKPAGKRMEQGSRKFAEAGRALSRVRNYARKRREGR